MKRLPIIYGKKYTYNNIEFMDYIFLTRYTGDNLHMKGYDFMYIFETKERTKKVFENMLESQINKLKESGYDYWKVIHEVRYGEIMKKNPFTL